MVSGPFLQFIPPGTYTWGRSITGRFSSSQPNTTNPPCTNTVDEPKFKLGDRVCHGACGGDNVWTVIGIEQKSGLYMYELTKSQGISWARAYESTIWLAPVYYPTLSQEIAALLV